MRSPGLAPSPLRRDRRRSGIGLERPHHRLPDLDDSRHDAARQAWRQFARAAGARRGRAPNPGRTLSRVLLVALGAALAFWLFADASDPSTGEGALTSVVRDEAANPETTLEATPNSLVERTPIEPAHAPGWNERGPVTSIEASTHSPEPPSQTSNPRLSPREATHDASTDWSGPKNPRAAPPGTPEANAEALRRIPVARADKAPIGGVGALGIHVDRIEIGSIYDAGKCSGHQTGFSASRHDRVSACFRVVHPRTTQQVNVLWQRDGDVVRRTKMTIPSSHAYRTRAFIVLRDSDGGRWTVRVLSSDDEELARARFEVKP